MILFFDIKKLEKESNSDPLLFIDILREHYQLSTKVIHYSKYRSIKGLSYLLNPQPLFKQNTDIFYYIQYIKLAAKRDFTLYKLFKEASLPLSYFPDIDLEAIKTNPLLIINKTNIKFKFEEYNGIKIWRH